MKIATKITVGFGVLIVLLLAVVAYQVLVVHRLQRINSELSRTNLRASSLALQIDHDLREIRAFIEKFFISRDPRFTVVLREFQESVERSMREIQRLASASEAREELGAFAQTWKAFSKRSADLRQAAPSQELEQLQVELMRSLDLLQKQSKAIAAATSESIRTQVERSANAAEHARRISWIAALAAVILGLLVPIAVLRSISERLRELANGTNAVAQREFSYRLDESRKDEFSAIARDFNSMAGRLEEAEQMKRDFVSHVSHELKAPLASIRETLNLLLEGVPGPLTEKQIRLLELSRQSSKRLYSMINNLLDLSRIEAGVMEYELKEQDVVGLVKTAMAEFGLPALERGHTIEAELPDHPLSVQCDGNRIIQVLENLLSNAVKYSPPGAPIQVRVSETCEIPDWVPPAERTKLADRLRNGFALISIVDQGPGVPDPYKEKIFEKFQQVRDPGTKAKGKGVGLGLAICKTIVDAHNGAIWVEDRRAGEGSVFRVLLPAEASRSRSVSTPI